MSEQKGNFKLDFDLTPYLSPAPPTLELIAELARTNPILIGSLGLSVVAVAVLTYVNFAAVKQELRREGTLMLLRTWLMVLASFEVFAAYELLVEDKDQDGFGSNLAQKPAEKRLWCFMLALLVASRVLAVNAIHLAPVRVHLAVVHVLEAVYMGSEKLRYASGGDTVIFSLILFNAAAFTALAVAPPKVVLNAACDEQQEQRQVTKKAEKKAKRT